MHHSLGQIHYESLISSLEIFGKYSENVVFIRTSEASIS